jgi:hypothetical protein
MINDESQRPGHSALLSFSFVLSPLPLSIVGVDSWVSFTVNEAALPQEKSIIVMREMLYVTLYMSSRAKYGVTPTAAGRVLGDQSRATWSIHLD